MTCVRMHKIIAIRERERDFLLPCPFPFSALSIKRIWEVEKERKRRKKKRSGEEVKESKRMMLDQRIKYIKMFKN